MDLEPIDPETALELYLTDRETEFADATLYSHRSRLSHFVDWCAKEELENLNTLTGRDVHRYRLWRREDGDLAIVTEKTQMDTLRVFIRWLESIDAVPTDLHTKVRSPSLSAGDNVRDDMLDNERADTILSYLERFEYASRPHVVLSLMWRTMMRVGAIHALDVDDYDSSENHIALRHRRESGTPIKNGTDGERLIALSDGLCDLLDDWIETRRPDVVDDAGRRPLITTAQGRAHRTTLRGDCYRYTRPCVVSDDCPHDRDIDECEAMEYNNESRCPSSVSPHALRRGGITHHLTQGIPQQVVGDRANVSSAVLEKHYDRRSEKQRMEQRREHLDSL